MSQIGKTDISLNTVGNMSPLITPANISLSALKLSYVGSSTAFADTSASKLSLWYLATCRSSANMQSSTPYVGGGLNSTKDKNSPNYTGWVYNQVQQPWNPASLSEFYGAANTRPKVVAAKITTGNPASFTLQLVGSWIDPTNAVAATPTDLDPNSFYFWVHGPGANFVVPRWIKSDGTGGPGGIQILNCVPGTYTVYVQDSLGAGNQFEFSNTFTYP